jgi:hypothetical protein
MVTAAPDAAGAHLPGPRLALRIPRSDTGLLPFLLLLPFLFVPKLLDGDTQPWVLLGAVFALFTYRPRQFLARRDLPALLLAVLALAAYTARVGLVLETVRAAYIYLMFAVFWVLGNRGGHGYFRVALCYVLGLWFLVGLAQYVAVQLGYDIAVSGRYVAGRSGVPSLAAEPSYFGSLSVVMAMYLLNGLKPHERPFIALAILNVLMSGSILAVLLLGFPLLYLRPRHLVLAVGAVVLLLLLDASVNQAGLSARLAGFQTAGQGLISILLDPSLNLRWGHIEFTMLANFWQSVFFLSPVSFEAQYNAYAASTGYLIATGGNFILPIAGELVYGGGLFGLLIILLLVWRGTIAGPTPWLRFVRGSFVLACLLNPVSIANPMFVYFVLQESAPKRPSRAQSPAGPKGH